MKKMNRITLLALLCMTLALAGCPDPRQALVFNQSSDNISSVDIATGSVTSNVGSLSIGPLANRAVLRGNNAYVVNSGAYPGATGASIQVIDLSTNNVVNMIPLPDGDNPWDIAFVSDTKAYITALYGNRVTVINPTLSGAAAITGTILLPVFNGPAGDVPAGPEGIVITGGYAFTANTGFDTATFGYVTGSVSVIDTATDTVTGLINTTQVNPQDLTVDAQGQINVICTGDYWSTFGVMDVIDPATLTVIDSVPLGGSPGNISIAGSYALIGAGDSDSCDLYMVHAATNAVVHDSADPWILANTSNWCTVGKIADGQGASGTWAFVPTGVWGGESSLFELQMAPGTPTLSRTFDLTTAANIPAAAGLLY